MNAVISGLAEGDYFEEYLAKDMRQKFRSPCAQQPDTSTKFSPTDMTDVTAVLALYGVFAAVAVAVFFVELILRRDRVRLCCVTTSRLDAT